MIALHHIPGLKNWRPDSFVLIAGPCAIEDEQLPLAIAARLSEICTSLDIPWIFKASYRKDNRTRYDSFRGIGDERGRLLLAQIRERYQVPVLTDVHTPQEAIETAPYVDVLQIPAFLCRQSSLLEAAAATGKWINIKKGQFLSPEVMQYSVEKVKQAGSSLVMVTERGASFGYQDLVVDFRGLPVMRSFAPVIFDCTHANQRPNQQAGVTGGTPQSIAILARAAVAVGIDGLFIETHPDPGSARSDGANMLPLDDLPGLLASLLKIHEVVSGE